MYSSDECVNKMMEKPQYTEIKMVDLVRDFVKSMDANLQSLRRVLELGFTKISNHNIENGVFVLGNTGCGKSTLLSALVDGSEALEEKSVTLEIKVKKKGQEIIKKVQKRVIDYKDEVMQRAFKIGHNSQSETFLPSFRAIPNLENSYYIDLAGLGDTDGDMLEFSNQFINKKLFSLVKNVIVLIPFTATSLQDSRGGPLIKQLEVLIHTF